MEKPADKHCFGHLTQLFDPVTARVETEQIRNPGQKSFSSSLVKDGSYCVKNKTGPFSALLLSGTLKKQKEALHPLFLFVCLFELSKCYSIPSPHC